MIKELCSIEETIVIRNKVKEMLWSDKDQVHKNHTEPTFFTSNQKLKDIGYLILEDQMYLEITLA